MQAPDDFAKLKAQIETADRSIREAAARGTDELKAMVEQHYGDGNGKQPQPQ